MTALRDARGRFLPSSEGTPKKKRKKRGHRAKGKHSPAAYSASAYEARERATFQADLREIERDPLRERQEGAADFAHVMRYDPEMVGERVGWLLDGSYGSGAQQAAQEVLARPRLNRQAWLTTTVGTLDWRSPQRMTAASYNKLPAAQKAALNAAIDRAIRERS